MILPIYLSFLAEEARMALESVADAEELAALSVNPKEHASISGSVERLSISKGQVFRELERIIKDTGPGFKIGILSPNAALVKQLKLEQLESDVVNVLPVYEAGGLEWDKVIIVGADRFDLRMVDEAKALYTGITRALRELILISLTQ